MDKELEHLIGMGMTPIGVAGDAGSDERRARLLVLKKHPHLLIADCWAHQVCDSVAKRQPYQLSFNRSLSSSATITKQMLMLCHGWIPLSKSYSGLTTTHMH